MKTGIIIQARMGSTRLPSKVLMTLPYLSNISVIERIINCAKEVSNSDLVILATTKNSIDDELVKHVNEVEEVTIFRGSEDNVLSRYYKAAKSYNLTQIVRLTGDNPCIDKNLITQAINYHLAKDSDYTFTKGLPLGMNIEVIKMAALERSFENAYTIMDREHVTIYIKNNPSEFKINYFKASNNPVYQNLRLTLDTQQDYNMMCVLFDNFINSPDGINFEAIKRLYQLKPYIFLINKDVKQKEVYSSLDEELIAVRKLCEENDLLRVSKLIKNRIG